MDSPVRVAMAKREAPGGAIQKWLAENETRRSTRGGRGLHGDLSRFLLSEAAEVHRGREKHGLTWSDVAQAAAAVGVVRADGQSYRAASFSTVWGRLTRAGKIARALGQTVPVVQKSATSARDAANGIVSPPRGQGGAPGVNGGQPSTPSTPTTPVPARPGEQQTGQASEQLKRSATAIPPRRRFGEET